MKRMKFTYSVLCDYGPDNYQSLKDWLTANSVGAYHFCYTTDPARPLPQIKFQYKQDASNFRVWIKTDPFQVLHQDYLNRTIANGSQYRQQQWRNV